MLNLTEEDLIHKLHKIEALYSGAKTKGEKEAAKNAINRIQDRLDQYRKFDHPKEWTLATGSMFEKKLLLALLRRYGLILYRYKRQKYTTVMVEASEGFINDILWPEYQEMAKVLRTHLDTLTDKIIGEAIHGDQSGEEIREEAPRISYQV